ncbi:DUF6642 family protein [Actinocatenispora rupis]|uniref:Uncharacterized protein n=1 Tax=Actinocatenispora rupis TaxID=519421 RepID=A0A8J3J5H5_9ACTN|nr:DUF6642 family protein [Actinocatenispora rupis]GID14498.1 hypothetical protein Aru02nite_53870 [Actinocatenispora rupis]
MSRGGVFCVEGQWARDLTSKGSVLPTLELLERIQSLRYIHKDVATAQELEYYLDRWTLKQYDDYNVGFFALHGEPQRLLLTEFNHHDNTIELDEVGEILAGKCTGRRLFFGSCAVLKAPDRALRDFLDRTGAALICGYTKTVDWVEAAAFETVLLDRLVNGKRVDSAESTMRSARFAAFADHLGFRVLYRNGR